MRILQPVFIMRRNTALLKSDMTKNEEKLHVTTKALSPPPTATNLCYYFANHLVTSSSI